MTEHLLDTAYDNLVAVMDAKPDYVEFSLVDIAKPAPGYGTEKLLIKKHTRTCGGYIADQALFIAPHDIFRRLGLLIAATLMHDVKGDQIIRVNLNNPASELKALFIDCRSSKIYFGEMLRGRKMLDRFCWGYREMDRHPWIWRLPSDPWHLPHFDLTDQSDGEEFLMRRDERNYLRIDGSVEGLDRLSSFLLNISDKRNEITEFDLEGEDGFRGVAPASAEARFGLPGSVWWQCFGHEIDV